MPRHVLSGFIVLLMVPGFLACLTPNDNSCQSDTDCFSDQFCDASVCIARSSSDMAGDISDMPSDMRDMPVDMACVVDRFETECFDPSESETSNNSRSRATPLNPGMRVGCASDQTPQLFTMDAPIDAILCPAESSDYYAIGFSECRQRDVWIKATLTPTQMCFPGLVTLKGFVGGKEQLCGDPNIQCGETPEGGLEMEIKVPAKSTPQVNTAYFATDGAGRLDVLYNYQLRIETRIEESP